MKNLLKYRQNKWSEFGKGFIVKIRKNTGVLQAFQYSIIRKNTQVFLKFDILKFDICNIANINNMQNQESPNMNANKERLGNARSIR